MSQSGYPQQGTLPDIRKQYRSVGVKCTALLLEPMKKRRLKGDVLAVFHCLIWEDRRHEKFLLDISKTFFGRVVQYKNIAQRGWRTSILGWPDWTQPLEKVIWQDPQQKVRVEGTLGESFPHKLFWFSWICVSRHKEPVRDKPSFFGHELFWSLSE